MLWLLFCAAIGLLLWLELRTLPKPEAEMRAAAPQLLDAKKVVVVIAHPDDAEYWISGTLAMLDNLDARVVLVVASDGEKGRNLINAPDLAVARRAEQVAAGSVLGYDEIVFLGQPDRAAADNPDVPRMVREVLEKEQPDAAPADEPDKPPLLIPLRDLQASFGRFSGAQATLAYATSGLVVRRLIDEEGGLAVINLSSTRDTSSVTSFYTNSTKRWMCPGALKTSTWYGNLGRIR